MDVTSVPTSASKPKTCARDIPPLLQYYGDADKLEAWLQQALAKLEVDNLIYTKISLSES